MLMFHLVTWIGPLSAERVQGDDNPFRFLLDFMEAAVLNDNNLPWSVPGQAASPPAQLH